MIPIGCSNSNNKSYVSAAFDSLATKYDSLWTYGCVGALQREEVNQEIQQLFRLDEHVLEIGCGTGVDAVYLARAGIHVHAIDISPQMLLIAGTRIEREGLSHRVKLECRSIENLGDLQKPNTFDGAFSNFGAFNCVGDIHSTALNIARLIRPGGKLAICYINWFCLWETIWYLIHGKPRKAFRRLYGAKRGIETSLNSSFQFRVFYPKNGDLIKSFLPYFHPISSNGVGVMVPPSCMEEWAQKRKKLLYRLAALDRSVRRQPLLRCIGDHRLLILIRTD